MTFQVSDNSYGMYVFLSKSLEDYHETWNQYTPLMLAINMGSEEVVTLLLNHGALPDLSNAVGAFISSCHSNNISSVAVRSAGKLPC